mgnify:FL=1
MEVTLSEMFLDEVDVLPSFARRVPTAMTRPSKKFVVVVTDPQVGEVAFVVGPFSSESEAIGATRRLDGIGLHPDASPTNGPIHPLLTIDEAVNVVANDDRVRS